MLEKSKRVFIITLRVMDTWLLKQNLTGTESFVKDNTYSKEQVISTIENLIK